MSLFTNTNGELNPADRSVFHSDNRLFKFGDGIFETMRLCRGSVPFLAEHLDRLHKGMQMLGMQCSDVHDINYMHQEIKRLANRSRVLEGARIRLSVFREGAGTYIPETDRASWLMDILPLSPLFELNENGLRIGVFNTFKKPIHPFNAIKSANAQLFTQAGRFTKGNALDECIILNEKQRVCEGLHSNVFFLVHDQVITPSLDEGGLPGVMREFIIELLKKGGVDVLETQVNPTILEEAREVFYTNAIKGVQWVMGYGGKRYFHKLSGQLIDALNHEVELRLSLIADSQGNLA